MIPPLRICFLAGALEVDGPNVAALSLGTALHSRGHEVLVVGGDGPLRGRFESAGMEVWPTPLTGRLLLDYAALRGAKRTVAARRIDLVHVVDSRLLRHGPVLAGAADAPWVATLRSPRDLPVPEIPRPPARLLVACRAAWDELALSRRGTDGTVARIRHGIDPDRFPGNRTAGERTVVGALTRLDAGAGTEDLLAALRILLDRGRKLHVLLAGTGPAADAVRREARETGISRHVTVSTPPADYERLLGNLDVFVSPRREDWFGVEILLAMAAGLPVVATGVGPAFDAVREGSTGYLVPRGDVEALAERIDRLVVDPEHAAGLGAKGRWVAARRFGATGAAESTEAVYRAVVPGGTAAERRRSG